MWWSNYLKLHVVFKVGLIIDIDAAILGSRRNTPSPWDRPVIVLSLWATDSVWGSSCLVPSKSAGWSTPQEFYWSTKMTLSGSKCFMPDLFLALAKFLLTYSDRSLNSIRGENPLFLKRGEGTIGETLCWQARKQRFTLNIWSKYQ